MTIWGHPAQAAMLDAGCGAALGRLLARLLPALADPGKAAEAGALTTMALEVITVLANPDVCLNPASDPAQRAAEECIGVAEVRAALCSGARGGGLCAWVSLTAPSHPLLAVPCRCCSAGAEADPALCPFQLDLGICERLHLRLPAKACREQRVGALLCYWRCGFLV